MRRICVLYHLAHYWRGNKAVEWIVCKDCQRRLSRFAGSDSELPSCGTQPCRQARKKV